MAFVVYLKRYIHLVYDSLLTESLTHSPNLVDKGSIISWGGFEIKVLACFLRIWEPLSGERKEKPNKSENGGVICNLKSYY